MSSWFSRPINKYIGSSSNEEKIIQPQTDTERDRQTQRETEREAKRKRFCLFRINDLIECYVIEESERVGKRKGGREEYIIYTYMLCSSTALHLTLYVQYLILCEGKI